jgi:CheY-like chemotaxis protein
MKALVVDDNPAIRKLLSTLLHRLGIPADEAQHGSEAFAMLQATDYAIVISDVDMPFLNGIDLFHQTARCLPHMADRFIFCTSSAYPGKHDAFFSSFAGSVLHKPFMLKDLEYAVFQACAHYVNAS